MTPRETNRFQTGRTAGRYVTSVLYVAWMSAAMRMPLTTMGPACSRVELGQAEVVAGDGGVEHVARADERPAGGRSNRAFDLGDAGHLRGGLVPWVM